MWYHPWYAGRTYVFGSVGEGVTATYERGEYEDGDGDAYVVGFVSALVGPVLLDSEGVAAECSAAGIELGEETAKTSMRSVLDLLNLLKGSASGVETSAKEPVPDTPRIGCEMSLGKGRAGTTRRSSSGRRGCAVPGKGGKGRTHPTRARVFHNAFDSTVKPRA
jgi:hypothetical protein